MALLHRRVAPKAGVKCCDLNTMIQQKAYTLFEKRGYSNGNDWADWFEAERQVKTGLGRR